MNIDKFFDSLTEEDIENLKKKYFPESNIPKGWVSIREHLPMMLADDILAGGTEYRIKFEDGAEGCAIVSDHNMFKILAIQNNVTHWFNP